MTEEHGTSRPDESIVRWALLTGTVGFLGGFVGPMMLLPDSNLGPLLGFVTGPVGAYAGVLMGVARSARSAAPSFMPTIAGWFFAAWLLALVCTFFMVNLVNAQGLVLSAALQAMAVACAIYVFSQRDIREKWSLTARRRAPLAMATLVLIMIVTVFPPVTRPWWGSPQPTATDDRQRRQYRHAIANTNYPIRAQPAKHPDRSVVSLFPCAGTMKP